MSRGERHLVLNADFSSEVQQEDAVGNVHDRHAFDVFDRFGRRFGVGVVAGVHGEIAHFEIFVGANDIDGAGIAFGLGVASKTLANIPNVFSIWTRTVKL